MEARKLTVRQVLYPILLVLGIPTAFCMFRPDISLALALIENSWAYPSDDWRVTGATTYLIWTKDERIYDGLDHFFWSCHFNPSNEDVRAETVAEILGSIHTDEALDALQRVFTVPDYSDGFSGCERYVWQALLLQGDDGYKIIRNVAIGNLSQQDYFRSTAIKLLGESKDQHYVGLLAAILLNDRSWKSGIRPSTVCALASIGSPDALEYIEHASTSDPSDEVRAFAMRVLLDLEAQASPTFPYCGIAWRSPIP